MYENIVSFINRLIYVPSDGMVHPGLSVNWVLGIMVVMIAIVIRSMALKTNTSIISTGNLNLSRLPVIGLLFTALMAKPWVLFTLRIVASLIFLLVIYAGLFGTPIPERNIATVLTWTVWWSAVVISVFVIGSGWCAICPWDAIASWLVRRKLWKRGAESSSLSIRVPKSLRTIWPALIMFIGLTWLELGVGVTTSPYATALMALLMVVLATVSLATYERKAFCRYFCPIGRTLGAYAAMAPIALRPIDNQICADCKTLECYHGTQDVEPCPTHLVMGTLSQNTYCTSCGACSMSCPDHNVGWRLRGVGEEITHASRPHTDEAWFILGLLALTIFHGFTMMPYWEDWMRQLAYQIGDSGQILTSFTIGMTLAMLAPVVLYFLTIRLVHFLGHSQHHFQRVFNGLAFSLLPLAFTYHIAHNLSHLVRESDGFWSVLFNPLGVDAVPLSLSEMHMRHMNPLLDNEIVFALQATLVLSGFWLALRIARQRLADVVAPGSSKALAVVSFTPILILITGFSLINLWLLMQPMIMRM